MKVERRTFKVELRKSADGRKIRGTAVVFNQLSVDLGGFREQIAPEAFDGCDMTDVRCLVNHEATRILGRTASNTLSLAKEASGLCFECDPPDTSYARDLAACMDRGDIDLCSFSFRVAPKGDRWSKDPETGAQIRTVRKISRLYDVSVVTYAAYPQTSIEIRSSAEILSERQPAGESTPSDVLRCQVELAQLG